MITSINISRGGVPKRPIAAARIALNGIEGDAVDHPAIHGGPDRALSLYSFERIAALRDEGHPIEPGFAGENLTISGIDWDLVVPGVELTLGSTVKVSVRSFTSPCRTISSCFRGGAFQRIDQRIYPGWSRVYAAVLCEGEIKVGDDVKIP